MDIMNKLIFSVTVMLIGMVIVFFGLTILICCIKLLSALLDSKKKSSGSSPAPTPVVIPKPVAETAAAATGADANELVAVITAALTAYISNEKNSVASGKTLVVRNIRAAGQSAWARAGRVEQLNSRF